MPTYEYACTDCGRHLEKVQSFSDDPLTVCPTCGGPLRKVFGSIGIVLKGSGFYKNDSRSSNSSGKVANPKKDGGESAASSTPDSTSSSSSAGSDGASSSKGSESSTKSSGDAMPSKAAST